MRTFTFIVCLFIIQSCRDTSTAYAVTWTEEIKRKITEDASLPTDSISWGPVADEITLFHNRQKTRDILLDSNKRDTLAYVLYSTDQNFKLQVEFCPFLEESVECIYYKDMQVGMVEYVTCSDSKKLRGFMYNTNIGVWKETDAFGKLISTRDYGNIKELEKLREIKYYR